MIYKSSDGELEVSVSETRPGRILLSEVEPDFFKTYEPSSRYSSVAKTTQLELTMKLKTA